MSGAPEDERDTVHLQRLAAQWLGRDSTTTATTTATDVVEHLLAVQGQDTAGMRLAVRARSAGLTGTDIDAALGDRSLVVSWLNRGTLHLVRAEDWWWLHRLTTPQLVTGSRRRLQQEGVDAAATERGVATMEKALADDGPLLRAELRERLASAGVPVAGQALVHLLIAATLRGLVIRGPVAGPSGEQAFVLVRDWLGPAPQQPERDELLGRLVLRYLAGHGPAGERDLARWANVALGDVRRGLRQAGSAVVERLDGLLDLAGRDAAARPQLPRPMLLGPFDPVLLGWVSREDVVGESVGIVTSNGIFRRFALADGRAVALWKAPQSGELQLTPLPGLTAPFREALERDAVDLRRFGVC